VFKMPSVEALLALRSENFESNGKINLRNFTLRCKTPSTLLGFYFDPFLIWLELLRKASHCADFES